MAQDLASAAQRGIKVKVYLDNSKTYEEDKNEEAAALPEDKEYGEDEVEKAAKIVAGMRPDNPLRNIGYVVGILKREAR